MHAKTADKTVKIFAHKFQARAYMAVDKFVIGSVGDWLLADITES